MKLIKLIKLYADWCGPCKVLEKMLKDHNIEHENDNLVRKMTGLPATPTDLTKFVYE